MASLWAVWKAARLEASAQRLARRAIAMIGLQISSVLHERLAAEVKVFSLDNRYLLITLGYIGGVLDAMHQVGAGADSPKYDEQVVELALLRVASELLSDVVPSLKEHADIAATGVKSGVKCGWFGLQAASPIFNAGQTQGFDDMREFYREKRLPKSLYLIFENM